MMMSSFVILGGLVFRMRESEIGKRWYILGEV